MPTPRTQNQFARSIDRVVWFLPAILLGALTTVAVSWYLAAYSDSSGDWSRGGVASSDKRFLRFCCTPPAPVESIYSFPTQFDRDQLTPDDVRDLPAWSTLASNVDSAGAYYDAVQVRLGANYLQIQETATGWPMRAMVAMSQFRVSAPLALSGLALGELPPPAPVADPFGGIPNLGYLFYQRHSPRILPIRPYWPGFLANTAFYSIPFILLTPLPALIRRRLRARRGNCLHCGYSREGLQPATPCPECGNPARKPWFLPGSSIHHSAFNIPPDLPAFIRSCPSCSSMFNSPAFTPPCAPPLAQNAHPKTPSPATFSKFSLTPAHQQVNPSLHPPCAPLSAQKGAPSPLG